MILKDEDFFRISAISEINALREAELKHYLQDEIYRPQMIAYFGDEEYESLRELLAAPPHFGARETEIILLPGIMGSELADSRQKVWVNLRGLIIDGCFALLELDSTGQNPEPSSSLVSIGLYKRAYFKTQVWLEKKGYTVRSFAYDWRKPIDESAHQLKVFVEELAADQMNKQFVFVAHSMGGLVVRRYLDIFGTQAEERLEKLIMLGTPNNGSYLPLIAMKGDFPIVKIAGFRYGGAIVRKIVQSFPGLYELCPNPEIFGQPDIYKVGYWSEESINAQHLRAAQMFHKKIQARLPEKMFLIANRSLKTITRVEREEDSNGWRYKFLGARVGDGTVPFESAYLREIVTYKTQAEHGSIQKDDAVLHAIDDLINEGQTERLDCYTPHFSSISVEDLEEIDPNEVVLEL